MTVCTRIKVMFYEKYHVSEERNTIHV